MTKKFADIAMYNFWNGNMPDLGYKRDVYVDKLQRFSGNRLIKVLVGQRRSGKSYILKQVLKKLIDAGLNPSNTLYINKEHIEFDFITDYTILATYIESFKKEFKTKGRVFVFIDEIQNIQGWERAVTSYSQSTAEEMEFFISGSNSKLLSGELATYLSGRYISMEIFPFSFLEYCDYKQVEANKSAYTDFLKSGGLPELFHLPDDEARRYYISAIKDTVLLRDIIQRYNIKDAKLLDDIFAYLINNSSNLLSVSNIVNYFKSKNRKTNYETVSSYISYIEQTYLIHRVERYSIKGKDILNGNCKYYANDLSFKNLLYAGYSYGLGYMLENTVFLQLKQAGFTVYTGMMRNAEVDFVAMKNDRVMYFQVAYVLADEETSKREYGAFSSIKDNYEKYLITMDDLQLPSNNGIQHIQAWNLENQLRK